jgi:Icc-related predicted phosphoesterase
MRLLCITDLHDQRSTLEQILADAGPVDAVLLGGDLTNFGSPADAERLVQRVQASGLRVLAVAGNCDSAAIEQHLIHLGVSLFRRGIVLDHVGLQGLSGMPPWHTFMYQFSEDDLAAALDLGAKQLEGVATHVVLSHAPPRAERVDLTSQGRHVGSTALRTFIDRVQPALVVCGHIHEGRGTETLGRTLVVNCGAAATGSYALAHLEQTVRVELRQL